MGLKDMFKNENGSSDLSVVSESGVVNTIHWCSDAEAGAEKPLSQVTPSQADGCQHPVKRGNVGSRETLRKV